MGCSDIEITPQPDHRYRRGGGPHRPLLLLGDRRLRPTDRAGHPAEGRHAEGPAQPADHGGRQRDRPSAGGSPRRRWACSWATTPSARSSTTTSTTCSTRASPWARSRTSGRARRPATSSSTTTSTTSARGCSATSPGSTPAARPKSRIAFNVVHDVTRRDYGGWGIYPDEGAHDLLIRQNLVYRCQDGALFAHHNRDITAENNIFALNRGAQVERGGIGGFELTCRRNLFYYAEGKAVGDYGSEHSGRDVCAFDRNLYWNASGKPVLFGTMSFAEWQATGQDKDSRVADPMFVAPEKGDFRLRPGSPAAEVGFEPWDFSTVGPRPAAAKRE